MTKRLILGAGGFSKQVVDVCTESGYEVMGVFDDYIATDTLWYTTLKVTGPLHWAEKHTDVEAFCGVGNNAARERIFKSLALRWCNVIDKRSHISATVNMGIANYVGSGARLIADSVIGNGNFFNDMSSIGHDVTIGNFTHLAPHACVGGGVTLGDRVFLGTGAVVQPYLNVAPGVTLGGNAVATKNCDVENGIYVGVPARCIGVKEEEEEE